MGPIADWGFKSRFWSLRISALKPRATPKNLRSWLPSSGANQVALEQILEPEVGRFWLVMRQGFNSLPLFSALDGGAVETIMSMAYEKRRWRDQTIFCEGEPVREIFLLQSGSVKLTQTRANGNQVILRLLSRGDIVGPVFGRDGRQRCTARAVQSSALVLWDADVFESLLRQFPAFHLSTMKAIEEQLMEMEQRFWGAAQCIESRLSNELLRLTSKFEQQNRKAERRIVLSHLELAQLTGVSIAAISHLLREWQIKRILAIQRGAVAVHNLDALSRIAEGD
jgi:CRP-like cAMP-binding protein